MCISSRLVFRGAETLGASIVLPEVRVAATSLPGGDTSWELVLAAAVAAGGWIATGFAGAIAFAGRAAFGLETAGGSAAGFRSEAAAPVT
jgi:hypothetical protein